MHSKSHLNRPVSLGRCLLAMHSLIISSQSSLTGTAWWFSARAWLFRARTTSQRYHTMRRGSTLLSIVWRVPLGTWFRKSRIQRRWPRSWPPSVMTSRASPATSRLWKVLSRFGNLSKTPHTRFHLRLRWKLTRNHCSLLRGGLWSKNRPANYRVAMSMEWGLKQN